MQPDLLKIKLEGNNKNSNNSQPISVKSASKLQEFKRAVNNLKEHKAEGASGNRNISHDRTKIPTTNKESMENTNAQLNITDILAKHSMPRSKSNPKGIKLPLNHNRSIAIFQINKSTSSSKSLYKSYIGSYNHQSDLASKTRNLRSSSKPNNNINSTVSKIYGQTQSDQETRKSLSRYKKGRNTAGMSHSQFIDINNILKDPKASHVLPRIEENTRPNSKNKRSKKSTKYTTDESCKTLEDGIEEMHMALVAHYQKVKRMLRKVEVKESIKLKDCLDSNKPHENEPSILPLSDILI